MASPRSASRGAPAPDIALAERLFAELRERTSDHDGVTRMSYGAGEEIAHAIVRREAEALGLGIETDAACNLYVTLPGATEGRSVVIGSHLDSVPIGGNYDGAAGVLMGLAVLSGLIEAGCTPPRSVTLMSIRAEESAWFGSSYIGSRASFGVLTKDELNTVTRAGDGTILRDAIANCGGYPDRLAQGEAFWSAQDIGVFIEPHIEQGDLLSEANTPVGIVTDIRGSFRYRQAVCRGAYAHSGTTPYNSRRDAVRAVSLLVVELDHLWRRLRDEGEDLTITVGEFATDPKEGSFSKVSGLVRFSLDIRSNSPDTLARVAKELDELVSTISADQDVDFTLGPRTSTTPTAMHPVVAERLARAGERLAVPVTKMPCGAGHDAATFAAQNVPTGMMLIRNENGSHNPDEHMAMDDFALGAAILLDFCLTPPDLR